VEGGGDIHYSFLEQHLAQKLYVYMAPKVFGGKNAKAPVGGEGIALPKDAFTLRLLQSQVLEGDILLEYSIESK